MLTIEQQSALMASMAQDAQAKASRLKRVMEYETEMSRMLQDCVARIAHGEAADPREDARRTLSAVAGLSGLALDEGSQRQEKRAGGQI